MSQQLIRLEREIQATADRSEWIRLSAKIAIALARNGKIEDARQKIDLLRGISKDAQIGPFHVWVMLAEAIAEWYLSLNSSALDRVTRVQLLSSAMRFTEVHATSLAWKAHIQFETSDFDGMLRSLQIAFADFNSSNSDANTRLALIMCSAYSFCGDIRLAHVWFMRGRDFALAEGDFPSIEALQYNRAVLMLYRARAASSLTKADTTRIQELRKEIESARNFQSITNNSTLANHLQLAEARLLLLEGRHSEARVALSEVRDKAPFASYHFSQSLISLEIAFCFFADGEVERAMGLVSTLDFSSYSTLDIDEQLCAMRIRTELAAADPKFGSLDELIEQKVKLENAYAKVQADLLAGLRDLEVKYEPL